ETLTMSWHPGMHRPNSSVSFNPAHTVARIAGIRRLPFMSMLISKRLIQARPTDGPPFTGKAQVGKLGSHPASAPALRRAHPPGSGDLLRKREVGGRIAWSRQAASVHPHPSAYASATRR